MRRLFWALAFFSFLGGLTYSVLSFLEEAFQATGSLSTSQLILIPEGARLIEIASLLHDKGMIDHPYLFLGMARLKGVARHLKAGEYQIAPYSSPESILNLLVSGKVYLHKVTIPEGITSQETQKILRDLESLSGEVQDFLPEGILLPETYFFARGTLRQTLLQRMKEAQKELLEKLWRNRSSTCFLNTKEEALVLASLVEKETSLSEERPLIAGVFINRLKRKMLLQSDPTITYILHKEEGTPLNQGLSKADLKYPSPFNTYLHLGLPPAPICNPGKASLEAVFAPESTELLYFVADGRGGHLFSAELKQHQKNHAHWRKVRKEQHQLKKGYE